MRAVREEHSSGSKSRFIMKRQVIFCCEHLMSMTMSLCASFRRFANIPSKLNLPKTQPLLYLNISYFIHFYSRHPYEITHTLIYCSKGKQHIISNLHQFETLNIKIQFGTNYSVHHELQYAYIRESVDSLCLHDNCQAKMISQRVHAWRLTF